MLRQKGWFTTKNRRENSSAHSPSTTTTKATSPKTATKATRFNKSPTDRSSSPSWRRFRRWKRRRYYWSFTSPIGALRIRHFKSWSITHPTSTQTTTSKKPISNPTNATTHNHINNNHNHHHRTPRSPPRMSRYLHCTLPILHMFWKRRNHRTIQMRQKENHLLFSKNRRKRTQRTTPPSRSYPPPPSSHTRTTSHRQQHPPERQRPSQPRRQVPFPRHQ